MITSSSIYWSCRRGMLELDLWLIPFVDTCFDSLTLQEKHNFVRFLRGSDPTLYRWLSNQEKAADEGFQILIKKIQAHASATNIY